MSRIKGRYIAYFSVEYAYGRDEDTRSLFSMKNDLETGVVDGEIVDAISELFGGNASTVVRLTHIYSEIHEED